MSRLMTLLATVNDVRTGRRSTWDVLKTALATGSALALLVVLLFPVYWIVAAALSGGTSLLSSEGVFGDPTNYNLDSFRWVFFESGFIGALQNSFVIVMVTVTTTLLLSVPGAYALSRLDFAGRSRILYGYVLFTQVGAGLSIATLVALYAVFTSLGLTNNLVALGLFYAAGAIPFNTWLLKTFLDNIPVSYEEAAIVDGASRWQVVWEVILPLSKPGLAVVLVFSFLAGWNEFIIAQTLLRAENYPLSVELWALATQEYGTDWTQFAAFAVVFASPVAIIYFFAQNYVESGLSFGGMEG